METIITTSQVRRAFVIDAVDPIVEFARMEREAIARVAARMASEQLGEAFRGLDTDCRNS